MQRLMKALGIGQKARKSKRQNYSDIVGPLVNMIDNLHAHVEEKAGHVARVDRDMEALAVERKEAALEGHKSQQAINFFGGLKDIASLTHDDVAE